jgi:hypothetical protein
VSGWIAVTIAGHSAERRQEKNVRNFFGGDKKSEFT